MSNLKTWVEIDQAAIRHNYKTLRSLLGGKTKLLAVVKSNAYGHGLVLISKILDKLGVDGFCVDSVVEGIKLRDNGTKKPILVLGPTIFPKLFKEAAAHDVTITISNLEGLRELAKSKHKPNFHLKIDTGMHRQGFYVSELPQVIRNLKLEIRNSLKGVYTHFASAKDINYPTFTDEQFSEFQKAIKILEKAGYKNILRHCAATGALLINKKYHLDVVRSGIGFYGLWPSKELEIQLGDKINLRSVLSWHSIVSEVKEVQSGGYIGYDLTERASKKMKIAVIPIGYWYGFARGLSGIGEILINGRRCRVLGRVSMDLIVADATGLKCKPRDKVVLIGKQKNENLPASEMAQKLGTTHYEIVTRINPLIERVAV